MEINNKIESKSIKEILSENINTIKSRKRYTLFFMILALLLIIILINIIINNSKTYNKTGKKHIALIEITGTIAYKEKTNAKNIIKSLN